MFKTDPGYNDYFRSVVLVGLTCGLQHPIEWVLNYDRMPGVPVPMEHYEHSERYAPRFLIEMYSTYGPPPDGQKVTADTILDWCDAHYPEDHMARGYFRHLKPRFEIALRAHAAWVEQASAPRVEVEAVLAGESLVILGSPGNLPERFSEAHNCDALGCGSVGPHILGRVHLVP